ncbi:MULTISPECIES: type-F conjugative transfer system secretin TraK [unclassified Pseudomonas]|uniref:TraK domain-containing protein n=1 Tax=unclassified Pseudomonas TaxID=196821 RepID=UPI000C86DD65|nr:MULTISPECIES: type-F conjugative transfer system secretin TraK [unclassified Pseudomonas]PMV96452.1 conjugal transfer protein TraK [Pseudomonas sp. GW460-C8]PMW23360.1 conjugal transfer protein TraK [Pseudomonas sp. GW456-E6]PMW24164.1 conjugal transfer protein TraK [Pseudomonas sp. GW456-11-11-14-TSB2]PMW40058.1 conjugal transfer protein TraK [Pseudomonas sp. GW460-7]PMW41169.1 conjugal transfer protein TraK [Pseudomonas sp. FW305-3-2-15-A-R2A1]
MKRSAIALIALVSLQATVAVADGMSNLKLPPVPTAEKRSKPVEAQPLPGLGLMPGSKEELRTNVVRVGSDRNEIVYVSSVLPNRISTPFAEPRSVDQQKDDVDISPVGQSLYVTMKPTGKSVALYITGSNPNDPVISLTLVPKEMPPQTIVLQLDKAQADTGGKSEADHAPDSNVYTDNIRYILREAALGKTPEGFSEGLLPSAAANIGNVIAYPKVRYSGPTYDIYRYTILGTTPNDVDLDEGTFYSEGVRAVSFFPTATLRNGKTTEVFIVSDKSATGD